MALVDMAFDVDAAEKTTDRCAAAAALTATDGVAKQPVEQSFIHFDFFIILLYFSHRVGRTLSLSHGRR